MFQAAQRIGSAVRSVQDVEGKALGKAQVEHDVSFLFGGQIKGGRMQLFMIYSAGNFIECTIDTPYLRIGERKYGKPVLDRAIGYDTDLYDALKIGLISMDSTMRSNLGVGLPIDLLVVTCARAGRPRCGPPISRSRVRPIAGPPGTKEHQELQGDIQLYPQLIELVELRVRATGHRSTKTKANSKFCPLASGPKSLMGRTL